MSLTVYKFDVLKCWNIISLKNVNRSLNYIKFGWIIWFKYRNKWENLIYLFLFWFPKCILWNSRAFLIQFLAIIAGQLHIFFGFSKRCLNFSCCFSTMFVTSLVAFQLLLHSAFQLFSTILRVKVNIYFSYNDSDDWMKKGDIYECL